MSEISFWRDDAIEKAAQIVEQYGADPQIAADIRALLSKAHVRGGVKVKALEWVETGRSGFLEQVRYAVVDDLPFPAHEPFQSHWGIEEGYGDEAGTFNAKLWCGNQMVKRIGPFVSVDDAAAAAQADYEHRILNALADASS